MSTATPRALVLIEKILLGFIAGAAGAIGVVDALIGFQRIRNLATSDVTAVSGMHLLDASSDALGPNVFTAIDSVTVTVLDLPDPARGLLVTAAILGGLLTPLVCAAVVWLSLRVFVGRPFVTSVTWAIGSVAIAIIVCGIGSQFFTGLAHAEVVRFLDTDAFDPLTMQIDLAPFGWAAALAVVGACFELGQRLQRDTDGLV